jgi:type II secretory pathway pseudopilin PulG
MLYIRNKNRGIGLLELMLSLAIIAAVILMATRYFTQASEASKVTQATQMIHTLIDASFKWVEGEPNFLGKDEKNPISKEQLVTAGLLPNEWLDKKNPWGNDIDLQPLKDYKNQIEIILYGAPKSACESINDIMVKQGVAEYSCENSGYHAIYPAKDPYPPPP